MHFNKIKQVCFRVRVAWGLLRNGDTEILLTGAGDGMQYSSSKVKNVCIDCIIC